MFNKSLFDRVLKISAIRWQRVLEHPQIMKGFLNKILLIIFDGLTKENCIAAFLFSKKVTQLVRKSGLVFTALYLKQCSSSLQQAYGGDACSHGLLPVPVSLSRAGYPRIIPAYHRRKIRRKDENADRLVQMYLSFFSLNRVVQHSIPVRSSMFDSIRSHLEDSVSVNKVLGEFYHSAPILIDRYMPWIRRIPLFQGMRWIPTWKSLPNFPRVTDRIRRDAVKSPFKREMMRAVPIRSCFPCLELEMRATVIALDLSRSVLKLPNTVGLFWPDRVRYALDLNNILFSKLDQVEFEKSVCGPRDWSNIDLTPADVPLFGRLCCTVEGGAKRRVFAIGNYVRQRLLKPIHDWSMNVLRRLPMDGTFDQTRPLDRLKGESVCYSYDLKSATDRWPLSLMSSLLHMMFGRQFADGLTDALAFNLFKIQFVKSDASISFQAGQPLGYYSSWPLFALTHHLIVMLAADKIYPDRRFLKYAVLGDDVVICDELVAKSYSDLVSRLGVKISYQKSLVSHRGAGEFAKRFRVNNMQDDISPVSVKALMNFFHPYGLMAISEKYKIKRFSTLCRIGGMGFSQRSKMTHLLHPRFRRLYAFWMKSRLARHDVEWLLGRGVPLNPYSKGQILQFLRDRMVPKDLKLPPEWCFNTECEREFQEWTLYRGWMEQWLVYLRWYCSTAMRLDISIAELLDAPVVEFNWKATNRAENLVRFGLFWKIFDMAFKMPKVPILGP